VNMFLSNNVMPTPGGTIFPAVMVPTEREREREK